MMSTIATAAAMGGERNGNNKFPFTATQWQELEYQALIYKYLMAGVPVPPDLLFAIKRSLESSHSLSSSKFISFPSYHPASPCWNAYNQIGYGKKIDPEPGRCGRTDGKKWRCSKEAYPDSKYCERHMHRGKNRSRKPVEININPNFTTNTNSNSSISNNVTVGSSTITSTNNNNSSCSPNSASLTHQSLRTQPYHSLSTIPSSHSPYNSLYCQAYYSHKDYSSRERYKYQGLKEELGEHAFLTDSCSGSSSMRSTIIDDNNWQIGGYNSVNNNNPNEQQMKQQQEKQCYIWGRDFNCDLSMRVEEEEKERENRNNDVENDKTTLHFFDEWPLKTRGSDGIKGRDSCSLWNESSPSTTQLSISIPTSSSVSHHHDFFLSNSRAHHHDS